MLATSANNPVLSWGADGLLGLGLNSLSMVDHLVNNTDSSWGRELEPEYEAAINETEVIPTWPVVNPTRWSVLIDGYDTTGAITHTLSSVVPGVPSGKAVALLDSGTSYSYASEEFCKNIYSTIPGAKFSSTLGQWVVPCEEEVNLGLTIDGRRFPVHPLDISSPSLSSNDNTTCYGTFIPLTFTVGAGEFDVLLGDIFLRNVYSLYDLGDFEDNQDMVMGNPYIKLLSITNGTASSQEFHKVRGGSASEANKISNAQASSGSASASTTVSVSTSTLDRLVRYTEILLSLLAVSTTLLILGIGITVYYVFFRREQNSPAGGDPGLDISGFSLNHLRPPGPVYQQVPSARSSLVP
ncbi:hypothetical protein BN14_02102 [Rhizoctonia solani AG-1 IB]|uniref:Peptidase A1 domain-containing protein n=1 Tax=Thanatephorus cucumeris (strain AG1-IB / isolate 7/3/14) TaxID=1108050 RepID=M5BP73_THACB|nr:hypothetical protein BN14_02102 [Rhizoctonia solani AG-1 IB]